MTTLAAVRGVLPEHRYDQEQLTALFTELCVPDRRSHPVVRRMHGNAQVDTRHLALPIQRYRELDSFTAANDAFLREAVELGVQAVQQALDAAGVAPDEVDVIMSTTVTGVAVPSLDARIAARVGLRPDVRRVPLFGLGCLAGAAGIARLDELLHVRPAGVGVLLSVELCSLTVQRDDPSAANIVASGLFGDGAAAVVAVGPEHRAARHGGPAVLGSASHLYPDTDRAMGWDVGSTGLHVVLGAEVPELVHTYLAADVDAFLAQHGLVRADIARWVCHPGGPKVLEAIAATLDLPREELALTWDSLRRIGNLSSASVLHVLADTLRERPASPGDLGLVLAMGPGFCAELVLVRW